MKLAVVWTSPSATSVGGVENHIRYLARELAARGHQLRVFVPTREPDETVRNAAGLDVVPISVRIPRLAPRAVGSGLGYVASYASRLAMNVSCHTLVRAVQNFRPDVVWQHDLSASWCAVSVLSRRYPVVLTNHTGEYLEYSRRRVLRSLLPLMLRPYAAILGPSRELTPNRPNATYLPNGVDTTLFRSLSRDDRISLRRRLGLGVEDFVVFCPRRWAPSKGVIYMARAAEELGPSATAVFAGDECAEFPSYVREVEASLAMSAVPTVRLGNLDVSELLPWYQAADVTVIPSLLEATSLSALESMACGVPVLATRVGGLPELITDGITGVLVPPADPGAIARALNALAAQPELRSTLGQASREVALQHDWSRIADLTESVLRSAAGRAGMTP